MPYQLIYIAYLKIPKNYQTVVFSEHLITQMPDKGTVCQSLDGIKARIVIIRYLINYNKYLYQKDEYPSIRDFYKKMYEMLNEQIVLKKI